MGGQMVGGQQELIACVLDLFAQQFPRRAVLRGGMVLRVLGSPRFTNDLDSETSHSDWSNGVWE